MQMKLARQDDGGPEIFRSFQGEGPMAGRVRTFIRLSGCNLACRWCDTAYTWNWAGSGREHEQDAPGRPHQFDPAHEMLKLDLKEALERVLALPAPGVVVTGGEPLLQRDAVLRLGAGLKARAPALSLELETNGAIAPPPGLAELFDLVVASPKLRHSGNDLALALNRDSLAALARLPQAVFKLVAASAADVAEAADLMRTLGVAGERVWIMPKGVTPLELERHTQAIWPSVLALGFQLSERAHIRLFGNSRGT